MIRRRTITSYVWNSVSGNKMVILSNCIRNFFRKFELLGNSTQGENPAPDNPQEIKSVGKEVKGKYLLDLKITGKNLFNLTDNYIWGWFASYQTQIALYSFNAVVYMPCKPNTTYTIYGRTNVNGNNNVKNRVATANDFPAGGTKLYNIAEAQLSNPVTITTDELSKYLVIMAVTDNECNIDTREQVLKQNVSKMMVIIGNTPTPYEPYTEQTVQIALNEPLRGIGEYKDTITKDGVARKIKQITVNEKSDLIFYMESKNTLAYLVKVPDATQTNYTYSTVSDRFVKTQYIDSNDTNGVVTLFGKQIIFRVSKEIANNIDALKEWLVDNNITFNYVLESPITEPLPESVQAQLSALHSENRVTHVFVDSGEVEAGINIEYKCKS